DLAVAEALAVLAHEHAALDAEHPVFLGRRLGRWLGGGRGRLLGGMGGGLLMLRGRLLLFRGGRLFLVRFGTRPRLGGGGGGTGGPGGGGGGGEQVLALPRPPALLHPLLPDEVLGPQRGAGRLRLQLRRREGAERLVVPREEPLDRHRSALVGTRPPPAG